MSSEFPDNPGFPSNFISTEESKLQSVISTLTFVENHAFCP